jgi:hypothetical protein
MHESTCPLHPNNAPKTSSVEELVEKAIGSRNPGFLVQMVDADEVMIEKYAGLLSTYCMTLDMMEVAADVFAVDRLQLVADFIRKALDRCINEIVAIQELRKNEEQ